MIVGMGVPRDLAYAFSHVILVSSHPSDHGSRVFYGLVARDTNGSCGSIIVVRSNCLKRLLGYLLQRIKRIRRIMSFCVLVIPQTTYLLGLSCIVWSYRTAGLSDTRVSRFRGGAILSRSSWYIESCSNAEVMWPRHGDVSTHRIGCNRVCRGDSLYLMLSHRALCTGIEFMQSRSCLITGSKLSLILYFPLCSHVIYVIVLKSQNYRRGCFAALSPRYNQGLRF